MPQISSLLRISLIAATLAGSVAHAQSGPPTAAANPMMGTVDGLLLLKNGETLEGRISRSGDYYLLITPTAEIQVRIREVEAVCRDLEEVFAKKLSLVNARSADSYLALAQWCIDRGLYGHAARALTDAIRLDDLHPRIALLERRMQAAMSTPRAVPTPPKPVAPAFNDEELDRAAKSIGAESLHEFTVRVQPLLMNYCATAGCHGPRPASTFHLERAYLNERTDPRTVRANLHATLKQIDRAQPNKSPLLNVPLTAHGGSKKPIFNAHNAEHFRSLAGWAARLPTQRNGVPVPTSADVVSATNTLQQRLPIAPPSTPATTASAMDSSDPAKLKTAVTLDAAGAAIPLPIGPSPAPTTSSSPTNGPATNGPPANSPAGIDPFDPDLFNRRREAEKK
ncbi:MAG: hypothetical protein K8U03_04610 [Planctomycetia bacterium]|nr:hypothetical protein [Planctomycetia bacterium]